MTDKETVEKPQAVADKCEAPCSALEQGETLEHMFVDHRVGNGEWANCKTCGKPVFVPRAIGFDDNAIVCTCGAIAFELAAYAVRRRRLPNATAHLEAGRENETLTRERDDE